MEVYHGGVKCIENGGILINAVKPLKIYDWHGNQTI